MRKQGRQLDAILWRPRWLSGKPFHSGLRDGREEKTTLDKLGIEGELEKVSGRDMRFPPVSNPRSLGDLCISVDRKESGEGNTQILKKARIKNTTGSVSTGERFLIF